MRVYVFGAIMGGLALLTGFVAKAKAPSTGGANAYEQRNLVTDEPNGPIRAAHVDPNLINSWGIAFNPDGFVWVADNQTGVATLYDGDGNLQPLVVTIPPPPPPANPPAIAAPTGIVFNGSPDFEVKSAGLSGPSRFIFVTEDGTISGWAPNVNLTQAILVVNNGPAGAIYKGLALAANGTGHFIYATDFHNGKIDVFDKDFHPATLSGTFHDPHIPAGFAPFGIQNLQGNIYVTYAMQDADAEDDVAGRGLGFVDVFDANGHLIRRVASRGKLNAPWGLALAPADFGRFSNRLLVGNFGDGAINAYDLATGERVGKLRRPDGEPLLIEGLWGISFGNGLQNQPTNTLFFASGPDDETHGLYGRIDAVPGSDHDDDDDDNE